MSEATKWRITVEVDDLTAARSSQLFNEICELVYEFEAVFGGNNATVSAEPRQNESEAEQ